MIQVLPDDLTEMRRRSIMLAVHVVFVGEHSLRVLAHHVAKSWHNITCQTLREYVQANDLVTNDTTPDVYGKAMLVVAFNNSVWIVMIP
jgi:hypothetical protein